MAVAYASSILVVAIQRPAVAQTGSELPISVAAKPRFRSAESRSGASISSAAVATISTLTFARHVRQRRQRLPSSLVACRFFGGIGAPTQAPDSAVAPPTWEELEEQLAKATPQQEAETLANLTSGVGPLSASAFGGSMIRLFGGSETDVRVKFWRDSAAWCPYCEKVQLALEEKEVPYSISKVSMNCYGDKPLEFLAKNPMGMLPVAEIDGDVIAESNRILEILEGGWDAKPLVPPGREAEVMNSLRLERRIFGSWLSWLRFPMDGSYRNTFISDLETVEQKLGEDLTGPYFLGEDFSIVECHFAPFLERMAASLAYFKGFQMRRNPDYPNLEAWFQAMESRDSYKALASDFYTHAHDLPPQLGGCAESGDNQTFRQEIDGATWQLPLPVDVPPSPVEPLLLNTAAEAEAGRREAARRLVANKSNVVQFCLRARGSPGFPPVGAELADPRASSSGDGNLSAGVDEALRSVVAHLLVGDGVAMTTDVVGPAAWCAPRNGDLGDCLAYLRDRVGVPRDMSFPAARQLRAHLSSYMEAYKAAVV